MSELICPKSGEPCKFYSYCASRKEALEEGGDLASLLMSRMPESIVQALGEAGFCADQRIERLVEVGNQENTPHPVAAVAVGMAAQLKVQRDLFPSPRLDEVA